MKNRIQISVRTLVEYVSRSGDLNLGFMSSNRPVQGIMGHQRIQNSRPENYRSEIPVQHIEEGENAELLITGRIDGIYQDPDGVIIDEIKTTYRDPDIYETKDNPLDWGQVKIYAYIYAIEHDLDTIHAQLTYYQLQTGRIREIRREYCLLDLEIFYRSIVDRYLEWMEITLAWEQRRNDSISSLAFPFSRYRPHQRRMAVGAYRAIKDKGRLFIQAATGIGKTMGVLFPSLKAMGECHTSRIFFLTARTTGRKAAEVALDEMRQKGLKLKSVTLTAKDKVCPNPEKTCAAEDCIFARGYYDRIDKAVADLFQKKDTFTREDIESVAHEYTLCPFEFSLDFALWADCIICDYNYVFDPRVYLRRFFTEKSNDYTILVDEAHNLVDRAREMFSAELQKQAFLDVRRPLKDRLPEIYKSMGKINSWMIKARKRCHENKGFIFEGDPPTDIYPLLKKFLKLTEDWLSLNIKAPFRDSLLDLYFDVLGFMRISDNFGEGHVTYRKSTSKNLFLKLFCIDPSRHLAVTLDKFRSAIFFSATITPADYFKYILGCDQDTPCMDLPSPFPGENLSLMISDRIPTYYRQREHTKKDVCRSIASVICLKKGNYLSFFPSYEYMTMVHEIFTLEYPEVETIVQSPGMAEKERDFFLDRFRDENKDTLVGFVVMGGIFGEGIDLKGEKLSGAIIIGVGLPAISQEQNLIKDYFDRVSGKGFNYAYLFPGINRVFQAAGRVIRTESDRGVVLLIDDRLTTQRYRSLFPLGWHPVIVKNHHSIKKQLENFWKG